MNRLTRFLAGLLCLLLLPMSPAIAESADELRALSDATLNARMAADGASSLQQWLDGPLSANPAGGAEWYVLALARREGLDLRAYRASLLEHMKAAPDPSAATRLKLALTLLATGSDDPVISQTLAECAGKQGIMSHIWALHLLNNGVTAPDVTTDGTLATLLSLQLPDGGWALYGTVSDPDVTAMVLQALAPHQADAAVRSAIEPALARLSALQRPAGDYVSFGTPNPETTAQVLIALAALEINGLTDERFTKEGTLLGGMLQYRLPDSTYAHRLGDKTNANATAQVFLALEAQQFLLNDTLGLYAVQNARNPTPEANIGYKPIACGIIALLALLGMGAVLLRRRSPKHCLTILLLAGALVALVCFTDIRPAEEYYNGELPEKAEAIGTVTLSVRCDAAVGLAPYIPADGVILPPTAFPIAQGDTVYTILTDAARAHGLHLEASGPAGMRYVQGLGYLYELAHGDLSGWLYFVNGESPSVGCEQQQLRDGDVIEWHYTLTMGQDLGR